MASRKKFENGEEERVETCPRGSPPNIRSKELPSHKDD